MNKTKGNITNKHDRKCKMHVSKAVKSISASLHGYASKLTIRGKRLIHKIESDNQRIGCINYGIFPLSNDFR